MAADCTSTPVLRDAEILAAAGKMPASGISLDNDSWAT